MVSGVKNISLFSKIIRGIFISIILAVLLIFSYVFILSNSGVGEKNAAVKLEIIDTNKDIRERLEVIEDEISDLKQVNNDLTKTKGNSKLKSKILLLELNISKLNNVILEKPEKAYAVTSLKKDIESLRKETEKETNSLSRELYNTFEVIKWVMGGVVMVVILLALSFFLKAFSGIES